MKVLLKKNVLLFVIFMFSSCGDYYQGFMFINNSSCDVHIYMDPFRNLELYEIAYPDTTIPKVIGGRQYNKGVSFSYGYSHAKENVWVDTVSIFIFDVDTLNMYSFEEIRNGYKILQRYDMIYKEVQALQYEITYPPTEAMRNIKMYPPYGSK